MSKLNSEKMALNHSISPIAPIEQWDRINEILSHKVKLEEGQTIRVYRDAASAVFECAFGLGQFLAHKRSIAIVKGQTNYFEFVTAHFYKQLINIQICHPHDFTSVKEWVEGLKKDTNFVLVAEDHPVTAERYGFVDELDSLLAEKKIFCIRLSHFLHRYHPLQVGIYTVQIQVHNSFAIAICGERFKTPPMLAHVQSWSEEDIVSFDKEELNYEDQNLVSTFEKSVSDISDAYFDASKSRIWDRSVVVLKNVAASAVIELLAERWGVTVDETLMSTTNQCLWDSLRQFKAWWSPTPSAEVLSCMLIVPVNVLSKKDFASELRGAYEEIRMMSNW